MVAGPVARGAIGTILLGKESTYGSAVAPTKDIGLVIGGGMSAESPITESHGYGQAQAVSVNPNVVNPKGSYELEMQHGRMLEYAIFGGTTTHADTTGDCTHTFVWANSLPSFTAEGSAELGATDLGLKYTGLIFDSTEISCALDGVLKMRAGWLAKDIVPLTSATAAVVNSGASLRGFAATLKLGGTAADYVQSWSVTVNRNTTSIKAQGQRTPAYAASHIANVTWKATLGFSETTQIVRLLGSASAITATEPAAFAAEFIADNAVTLGAGKRAFDMLLSGCQMKSFNKNYALKDFEMYDIEGSGIISTTTFVDQILTAAW